MPTPTKEIIGPEKSEVLGTVGSLAVRFAKDDADLKRAQALRHQVFVQENSGSFDTDSTQQILLDEDAFDPYCRHLLIEDHDGTESNELKLVGTYRFLHQKEALKLGQFYSESEFDIDDLVQKHPDLKFMELGRSCVLPDYRSRRAIELLWHGTWAHVLDQKVDVLFGCASFMGVDPNEHAQALAYLNAFHSPTPEWDTRAKPETALKMNLVDRGQIDPKKAVRSLPPLIKGYLRLGAFFASEAAVDENFGTIDVLVILPVKEISKRYIKHYGAAADRFR